MATKLIYPTENYFPSYHRALESVAKEGVYIEMIEPPPLEQVVVFQKSLIEKNGPVYYALEGDQVVGWCDIFPNENPRMNHRGNLGMGIVSGFRGQGLGSKLIEETLAHAKRFGLEKVELHVYTSNVSAIGLYHKFGFVEEGLIRDYRRLSGHTFDCLAMAKFL